MARIVKRGMSGGRLYVVVEDDYGLIRIIWQCWTCGIGGYLSDFQRIVKERGL